MDPTYPVYFVAEDLEIQARNKIRRYFMLKRESGGGDCGEIQQINEKLYKICFEQEEAQQRVLKRKTHTVSLPSGHLHLTVSRTEPEADLPITPILTSSKPPNVSNCLEKTFPSDIFFLHYLHDCSKALKILQKQFTCISCTVELNFDQEVVVVRSDAEKGLGGAFSGVPDKWEIQVNRIWSSFHESYTCHNELDSTIIKNLKQDTSFEEDDVKVYDELGYIVVVGETSIVNEKIQNVKRNAPTKTERPIDEGHFNLIEEEFTKEMRTNLPNVKIAICNNVIVFEGLDTEVQSGLALCDKLLKKIRQKPVQLSSELQHFFTTSDTIPKYKTRFQQCLRNPVSLEISNSDLVLSSLSMEAVDEAAAILERDFSTATVCLEGRAAVPPDFDQIKELIMKGKIYVQERRIDVNLVPGPNSTINVQLAGYSESVNKLKEELQDYLFNHVTVEDTLILPTAEMVDHFDQILTMIAPKDSRVSMRASPVPCSHVLLSGPQQIVSKTRVELTKELTSLISDTLVLDGPGARQYFNAEGKASKELIERSNQVFIQEVGITEEPEYSVPTGLPLTRNDEDVSRRSSVVDSPAPIRNPISDISIEIKLGCLAHEQVNVLVVPMLMKNLMSTRIGKSLVKKAGQQMKMKFNSAMKRSLAPGEVLEVIAPPSLGCSKLFFIECLPWDGFGGKSVKALISGLQRCLELCVEQGHRSVAFPVIGCGKVFQHPLHVAVLLLTEKLNQFGRTLPSTVENIHIVIKPDEDKTEEMYREVHKQLTLSINRGEQEIFRSISGELDDLSVTMGSGIQLELVFGDITKETTEAVVNSTNFDTLNTAVCKDILAVAGPEVEAELQSAKLRRGEVFVTQPGQFPCQGLLHVSGKGDTAHIHSLMGSIIQYCEVYEWTSVAMPAICAGAGGLSAGVVASVMLQGLNEALSMPLFSLVKVRVILNKINIFLAFKEEATQIFTAIKRVACPPAFLPPPPPVPEPAPPLPAIIDLTTRSSNQKSVFKITGLSQNNISKAMTTMKEVYQAQCSSTTFKEEELAALTPEDLSTLKAEVESLGLQVQSNNDNWTVSGLTIKVNQVIHLVQGFMYGTLTREVRIREEEDLYRRVMWCIQGPNGEWERLPKAANYKLEHNEIEDGILDAQGKEWVVNLQTMKVTNSLSTQALKRLENLHDFTFPLYWDNMTSDEKEKVVPLLPSCAEYKRVKEGFQLSCPKTVLKIERVQNIHLRRSYEAQLKHISDKNNLLGGANEKLLYHGTTEENAKSIMNTGFNRRFSGQNATSFGQGTYFAVNANYSAHPTYSKPAMDGTQLMFLARVLTGVHTQGQKDMRVPPPRDPHNPHVRFDSVVDRMDTPSMYIVFHDNQAYPDYLISFR